MSSVVYNNEENLLTTRYIKKTCYQRYCANCCGITFFFLSYILFGYICADGALLLYLHDPNKTETFGNHTLNIDTQEGKHFLLLTGGVGTILLSTMGTYKLAKICCFKRR
jgi:hypothetical protein|tara:strand:- start:1088 stop:1417 length:330 start_codon:yes stop_codon:yes gene_type:complete